MMIDFRKAELKRLVNLGYQAVLPYIRAAENGSLTKEEALSLVRDTIRKFTYEDIGGKNYLFMSAYDGTMLVQPYEPLKEGTPQWDLRDSRGVYIIRELIKAAKNGAGFVEYWYPAPGSDEPKQKVSYAIGIDILDCYLGTGLYMADILRISGAMAGNSAIIIMGVALFLAAFFLFVYRPFTLKQQAILVHLKAGEAAAVRERHLMKQLIDNLPGYAFFKDISGRYVTANRLFCEYLGFDPAWIEGKTDYELFPEDKAKQYRQEDETAAESVGGSISLMETLIHGGREIITSKRKVPVRDEGGGLLGILSLAMDVTALEISRAELSASLEQREILLKEIHHRVKNNLQIISSLLNLQAQTVRNKGYTALIHESINRIQSMATVHEMLYETQNFTHLNLGNYLHSIMVHLVGFYSIGPDKIDVRFSSDDVVIPLDKAVNCGLVVTELITNTLKYAFPGQRKGTVSLTVRKNGPATTLHIEDDGVGFPEAVFNEDDESEGKSLGFLLVKSLTAQMGGRITYSGEKGACFRIELPG